MPISLRSLKSLAGRWLFNPYTATLIACASLYTYGYHNGKAHQITAYKAAQSVQQQKQITDLQNRYKERDKDATQTQAQLDDVSKRYDSSLDSLNRLHQQLQAVRDSAKAGTVAAGKRNADTVILYSNLLEKSARRSSDLAAYADQLRLRLHQCNIESQ